MEQHPKLNRGTLEAARKHYLSQVERADIDHEKEITKRLKIPLSERVGHSQVLNSLIHRSTKSLIKKLEIKFRKHSGPWRRKYNRVTLNCGHTYYRMN